MASADVNRFETAGLYNPDAPDAADRLALLGWLTEQGFSLDQMIVAHATDRLTGMAGDRALRPDDHMNLAELAAVSGISAERIEEIRRAVGLAPEDPASPIYGDRDVLLFQTFDFGVGLFGERAARQFSRVMGNSLARIAETAVSMFLVDVEEPLKTGGGGELELAQATYAATKLLGSIPEAMDSLFRVHMLEAIRRSQRARCISGSYFAGYMAVGFVDLVGFTPLSQQLDWPELAALIDDFEGRANDLVTDHGGRVVKLIGDEVMFIASDAGAGCRIALDLFDGLRKDGGVTPRAGLAVGNVLTRAGDYFGPVVSLASRIAELAVPDEALVTKDVATGAADDADLIFAPAGRRQLKGFDDPVELCSVSPAV